jgi:hypothetical protein
MSATRGAAPICQSAEPTVYSTHRLRGEGYARTVVAPRSRNAGSACAPDTRLRADARIRRRHQRARAYRRQGLVDAEWGPSENNRRARYYTLTAAGRKRLREETSNWRRYSRAVEAVLQEA